MFDTHCHLTYPQFVDRLDAVIADAAAVGVDRLITIGTTPDDVIAARQVATRYDNVWFAAGVHPHYADKVDDVSWLGDIVRHERCVAFGEMGIDYHYPEPPRDVQHALFTAQLEQVKASGIDKPIVIHSRKATDDALAMIHNSRIDPARFVFHCFTESPDDCRKVLDAGAMISFTGIVTYNNAPEVRESAKLVPADRIMFETDAPYLSPEPHRKVRPNEPKFVAATAAFLADLRETPAEQFIAQCNANAQRFFGL